jgi:hypothetical protein
MVGLRDEHVSESAGLRRLGVGEKYLKLVEAFQVERNRSLRSVYLERVQVLPAHREARGFHRPDGAVLEFEDADESVVHVNRAGFGGILL